MKIYFAPLEGITGYVFRNAYEAVFGGIDKYFTPFITAGMNKAMTSRERNDILPENNKVSVLVPQILTNKGEDFCKLAEELRQLGYGEVNLNLGCPSKTVTSKKKGSGCLADPVELNKFLNVIFENSKLKISVKTRLGILEKEEFQELLRIFNQYPLEELIIHPRLQQDFYNGSPRREMFAYALENSKLPLCYNGDIGCKKDVLELKKEFPDLENVMIGRGFLHHPNFLEGTTKKQIQDFHGLVLNGYLEVLSGEKNVLFKMKEFWSYLIQGFEQGEKYGKQIRKTERFGVYEMIVKEVFQELKWNESP